MKNGILAGLLLAFVLPPISGVNAQTSAAIVQVQAAKVELAAKRKVSKRRTGERAQIACTVVGCIAVPRGCHQEPGKSWDGEPTGFDVIVCP